ncbi:alpha/beta hydrolase [Actinopolymorpha sp. B11F2]|uniref:alpha/beta hydrolase n=1 Tax=Actinopolymorpha sp. B11F2 TaxID=3160862 RepID=UPI0032E470DF
MLFVPTIDCDARLTLVPGNQYGSANGEPPPLDLVLPEKPTGAATIWLHGGGWFLGGREGGLSNWCASLAAPGIATATVDYRLSGHAAFPAQIDDVKAAIRRARTARACRLGCRTPPSTRGEHPSSRQK